jgi:hypothetical protein
VGLDRNMIVAKLDKLGVVEIKVRFPIPSWTYSYCKPVIPLPLSFLLFLFLALRFLVYNTSSSLASIDESDNRRGKNKKDLEISAIIIKGVKDSVSADLSVRPMSDR